MPLQTNTVHATKCDNMFCLNHRRLWKVERPLEAVRPVGILIVKHKSPALIPKKYLQSPLNSIGNPVRQQRPTTRSNEGY